MRPPEDSHPLPTRLGNFDIETTPDGRPRLLGRGTYGETYLARHRFLESHAAIKVIGERFLAQAKARERFLAEAKAVARLRHPHIAQVHDFGTIENGLFYAMEFCAGGNLAEWMRAKGSMSPAQLLAVAQQVASALKCCHAAGFIHRDLKPANLMLAGADGPLVVKLIDFGLVQSESQEDEGGGHRIGTPLYASPEQLREQDVDARSDLFSFGMTLWHLATGQPPDPGSSAEIIGSRLGPGSYAARLPANLPAQLRAVIEGLIEKDRTRRPAGAAQVLDALNGAALAMGAPIFTDLVHAPGSGAATAAAEIPATPAEVETFTGNLDGDFAITQVIGDSASGRTYLAQPAGVGTAPVVLHVLEAKVRANAKLLDRVRQNVGRLAALKPAALLAIGGMRAYADFTAILLDAPHDGDLLAALKLRGKVPIADARKLMETIAGTCDALTAAALPGIEMSAAQVFVPAGTGLAVEQWEPLLMPRFLTLRDRVESGETFLPMDGDATSTMTPEMLTETSADDLPGLFARLLYRITAGRDSPAAAGISMQGYVAIPELSEESNRTLAQVVAKATGYTVCGPLLGRILSLEGMGGTSATQTHAKTGARGTSATGPLPAFPKTAAKGTQTAARVAPIAPLRTHAPAPPQPRKMGVLIATLVVLALAAGGGGAWWWWTNRTPKPEAKPVAIVEPTVNPAVATPVPAIVPAADLLAAGSVVRLKAREMPGAAKFSVNGAMLTATRTEDGWDLTVPDGGVTLPFEIVGEVAGFSPEKILIEGRGDLRKPLDFFPKMKKGRLLFIAEQGCDYEEVGLKMTRPLDGGAGSMTAARAISFPIDAAGTTLAELEPGYYLLTLRSEQSNVERRWEKDLEVRAGTEQKFKLPPSLVGTYSGALTVNGSAAPGGAALNCRLTIEPGLSGTFTDGARRCAFEKGRLDAEGGLKVRLRWWRDEQGEHRFDWMLTAKRQPDATVLLEAVEVRVEDAQVEAGVEGKLSRQPYTAQQWTAAGPVKAARD